MKMQSRIFQIAIASRDVDAFLQACGEAEWYAYDTGERVMTEEGPDAEAVLLVDPAPRATVTSAAAVAQ